MRARGEVTRSVGWVRRLFAVAMVPVVSMLIGTSCADGAGETDHDIVREQYENGALRREAPMRNGKLHGTVLGWFENGQPQYRRTYYEGKEVGTHEGWHANGERRFEYAYADGLMNGVAREWSEDGRLVSEFHFVDGQESGQQQMWNADGSIRSNYVVRDGRRYGLLGALGCSGRQDSTATESLPFFRDSTLTPTWLTAAEARAPEMHRVAAFRADNQDGRSITHATLAGRITLVHFFFAHCVDICPTTTRNVARTLGAIGADPRAQVLSFTITPERDSVPMLRQFATRHGLTDPRWHLLTSDRAQVETLARTSFFVRIGDGTSWGVDQIAHTETVLLVDREGRLRGVYASSLPLEMERAAKDVRTLLAEE
jgi:protein SCO1